MSYVLVLVSCLFPGALNTTSPNTQQEKVDADQAESKATDWLKTLNDSGLVIVKQASKSRFVSRSIVGTESVMLVFQSDQWWITLGFSQPVSADSPLSQLRENFSYIALDRLPTPGLDLPGWEVSPRTPVSSFKEGVELLDYRDGKLTLRVKTKFFALGGRDPSVQVPADAPTPKSAYFQIRQEFPLDLTLVAPVSVDR